MRSGTASRRAVTRAFSTASEASAASRTLGRDAARLVATSDMCASGASISGTCVADGAASMAGGLITGVTRGLITGVAGVLIALRSAGMAGILIAMRFARIAGFLVAGGAGIAAGCSAVGRAGMLRGGRATNGAIVGAWNVGGPGAFSRASGAATGTLTLFLDSGKKAAHFDVEVEFIAGAFLLGEHPVSADISVSSDQKASAAQ